ncbi:putative adipose-regulatory protein-domain-containing protein [Gautieria morchelliformis]|nr:putative adipose-regulatory protein-domain-containing protein [Gautieria morchelliformis]
MSSSPEPRARKRPSNGSSGHSTTLALSLNLLATPLRFLRLLLPRVFPLIVCLLCIPVLMFFSGAAGWAVWRNVPVGWRTDVYLQYGDAINPFANQQLPPVMADQPYDISLHLLLPATESNFALGNFMATLKLTTAYNESITTVRRSAALVPPNASILKQSLLGSPSTTKVDIPLLSQFILGTSVVNARLELGRSDGWKGIGDGQGRELSVLEATLKGTVRPKGIRAILARYPRITTFVSIFTFFSISLTIVSGFLLVSLPRGSSSALPSSLENSSESDIEDGHDSSGPYPNIRRVSRRRSRKRDGESGSSAPEHGSKHSPKTESNIRISGLRNRRSNAVSESLDTSHRPHEVKAEVDELTSKLNAVPPSS